MIKSIPDFSKVRALVIGDVMLDQYVHGKVSRISPEAPVPVFNAGKLTHVAGGASNVATNLAALGCHVKVVGAIGKDEEGDALIRELDRVGIAHDFSFAAADRTTNKTRFVVGDKHLLRMDRDSKVEWRSSAVSKLNQWLTQELKHTDVVILSDYGKGVLTGDVCRTIIAASRKDGVPVMVDPKGRDYVKYSGATLIKPNLKELVEVSGKSIDMQSADWQKDISGIANHLCKQLKVSAFLVTLGDRGMLYVPAVNRMKPLYLPAEAKEVFDVSGAGDTSMAVASAALALNMSIPDAVGLANTASSIVVSKSGTSVVTMAELEIATRIKPRSKVLSLDECAKMTAAMKKQGKVIGFTNGCFDCCHLGHLKSLQSAKDLCDVLVVGVNSDEWIAKHKGNGRPIQDVATRTEILAAMECVDFVVVFSSETALPLVKKIRPQVIAKEGYSIDKWPEGQYVNSIGGEAVTLKRIEGYSTTTLAARMKEAK